jgi:hypothetical protein
MYHVAVIVACAIALAVLFVFSGWSRYKSNAGTLATAGSIVLVAIYLMLSA